MVKYFIDVNGSQVMVFLDTDNPNETVDLEFSGQEDKVTLIKNWLSNQYGAFGHLIDDTTNPIDLDAALIGQSEYKAEMLEGENVIAEYNPRIPESANT